MRILDEQYSTRGRTVTMSVAHGHRNSDLWRVLSLTCCALLQQVMCIELRSCEVISAASLCVPLGYPNTTFPNARGHSTQVEANNELKNFKPLIDIGCSPYIRHFLCAYYIPFCKNILPLDLDVPPCRELCANVRTACEPVVKAYGAEWPVHLSCEQFPTKEDAPWCFGPDVPTQLTTVARVHSTTISPQSTTPPPNEISTSSSSSERLALSLSTTTATEQPLATIETLEETPSVASEGSGEERSALQITEIFTSESAVVSVTPKSTVDLSTLQTAESSGFFSVDCTLKHTCSQITQAVLIKSTTTQQEQPVVPNTSEPLEAPSSHQSRMSTLLITPTRAETESTSGTTTAETTPSMAALTNTDLAISFTYLLLNTLSTSLETSSQHPFMQQNTSPPTLLSSTKPLTPTDSSHPASSTIPVTETTASSHTPFSSKPDLPASHSPLLLSKTFEHFTFPSLSRLSSGQAQPASPTPPPPHKDRHTCTPLRTSSKCYQFGHTMVSLPNLRGHKSQQKAEEELEQFSFFLRLKCSLLLEQFLCLYYFPPCNATLPSIPLYPCRELCQLVKGDCIATLNKFGLKWPHHMDCTQLPSHTDNMCTMEAPRDNLKSPAPTKVQGGTVRSNAHPVVMMTALVVSMLITKL